MNGFLARFNRWSSCSFITPPAEPTAPGPVTFPGPAPGPATWNGLPCDRAPTRLASLDSITLFISPKTGVQSKYRDF